MIFYFVNSFDDIKENINKIAQGHDQKAEDRLDSINEFWKYNDNNASSNILNLLENDKEKYKNKKKLK